MRENHRGFPSYLSVYPALFWRPGLPRPRLCMNVCKSLLRVATRKIRTVYRNGSSACGAAARAMSENHRGFPSYLSVYPALFWRPGSPRPRLCMNVCKSLLRVATQKNPNRIPEWEQRLRRSRTRDEGKPSVGLKGSMHHRLGLNEARAIQGGAGWEEQWLRSWRRSRSGTGEPEVSRCRRLQGVLTAAWRRF